MAPKTNSLAVVSLVAGILAWFVPLAGALTAIITGHMARGQIKASHGREEGMGFATAGLILGYVYLGLMVIGILLYIVFFVFMIGAFALTTAG